MQVGYQQLGSLVGQRAVFDLSTHAPRFRPSALSFTIIDFERTIFTASLLTDLYILALSPNHNHGYSLVSYSLCSAVHELPPSRM